VATDFASGAEVVLSRGSALEALLASVAIPAVFPPVALGGRDLVDGGIANNTPVTAAVSLGAGRVIVLPTGFSCHADPVPRRALGAALHALNLLIARQLVGDVQRLEAQVEVHVVPPLCPLARSAYDFSGSAELIDRALRSTRIWLESGGLAERAIPGALRPHAH
jgi:NTE family protein